MIASLITYAMIASVPLPPMKYDHEPTVPYTVTELTPEALDFVCDFPKRFNRGYACAIPLINAIYLRNDMTEDARRRILRHEIGHLNGWKHW